MAVGRRRTHHAVHNEEKHQTEKQDNRKEVGLKGDHGFTIDVTAVAPS